MGPQYSDAIGRACMTDARRLRQAELAKFMGLSRASLADYCHRPGAPRVKRGGDWAYLWPDFLTFYVAEREKRVREAAKPADFEAARARKMAAEAELAEVELARARREVVTVEDSAAALGAILDRVRAQLLALPPRLGVAAVGVRSVAEGTARMEPLIHEMLETLSAGDAS